MLEQLSGLMLDAHDCRAALLPEPDRTIVPVDPLVCKEKCELYHSKICRRCMGVITVGPEELNQ